MELIAITIAVIAGIAIGPWGLALVTDARQILDGTAAARGFLRLINLATGRYLTEQAGVSAAGAAGASGAAGAASGAGAAASQPQGAAASQPQAGAAASQPQAGAGSQQVGAGSQQLGAGSQQAGLQHLRPNRPALAC